MNLSELFRKQEIFNKNVMKNQRSHQGEFKYEKILALQVKIAQIANDTNCFKYCNLKTNIDKDLLLNKYMDCLYFIISIGLDNNYILKELQIKPLNINLTSQFETLYIDINDFVVCSSLDHYITLLEDYLSLGFSLNLSQKDILDFSIDNDNN